jgi:hypothetical protein
MGDDENWKKSRYSEKGMRQHTYKPDGGDKDARPGGRGAQGRGRGRRARGGGGREKGWAAARRAEESHDAPSCAPPHGQ